MTSKISIMICSKEFAFVNQKNNKKKKKKQVGKKKENEKENNKISTVCILSNSCMWFWLLCSYTQRGSSVFSSSLQMKYIELCI